MENQVQISNHSLSTPLNHKEIIIAQEMWHINQIISYPLSDWQIESWARSINELIPDLDVNILKKSINLLKTGEIEWDSKVGLPNIFLAIKQSGRISDSGIRMVY